jgi:copper chaperone
MQEFNVPDMSCGHCVAAVSKAIRTADPKAKVEVDLDNHKVRVDSSAERDKLAAALAEAGYPAR